MTKEKDTFIKKEAQLLFCKPIHPPSNAPVVDALTRKIAYLFKHATIVKTYRGFHTCSCGVRSDARDYCIKPTNTENSFTINSLCIHYLAYHRDEVDQEELNIITEIANTHGLLNTRETLALLQEPPICKKIILKIMMKLCYIIRK